MYTLTGRYPLGDLTGRDGERLLFTPSTTIVGDDNIILPADVMVALDSDGSFTVALVGTDDPDYTPSGWAWTVTEMMDGGRPPWSFELTADADLSDLTPVIPAEDYDLYVTPADLTAHNADTTGVHGIADTAQLATLSDLGAKADDATMITAGDGLTGGGTLAANRTLSVDPQVVMRRQDYGVTPPIAQHVTSVAVGAGPRLFGKIGDTLYGVVGTTGAIHTSPDAVTWALLNDTWPGASGWIHGMIPTSDGEVIAWNDTELRKSSGWVTPATATWSASKITPNGTCVVPQNAVSGDGTKFIAIEYNATLADWDQSRYAHISLDSGDTWAVVYDSEALHGAPASDASHLHTACYDPWSDRFYLSEGHGVAGGVYVSTDDGATWSATPMRAETINGVVDTNGPEVIVPTDDGLVIGSDNVHNGLFGVIRQDDPADEVMARTWVCITGRTGLVMFAQQGWRDPGNGLVYMSFRSEYADVPVVLAAGTASSGGLVYEWPTLPVVPGADRFVAVCRVGAAGLVWYGEISGVGYHWYATLNAPGAAIPTIADTGNMGGGATSDATSVSVGRADSTGNYSTSVGHKAGGAASDAVAVGYEAATSADAAVAVGRSSAAGNAAVSVGRSAASLLFGTAVGYAARADFGYWGTAVGASAKAHANSVALGYAADASGYAGVIVIGANATATGPAQVRLGAYHIEIDEVADPDAPAANRARLFARDNGAGKTQICVRFATGAVVVIATEP